MLRKTVTISMLLSFFLMVTAGCGSSADVVSAETPTETVAETVQEDVGVAKTEVETETVTEVTEPDVLPDRLFGDSHIPTFELTSEDLHDGVWDTVVSNTEVGSNVSPQLTWEAVADAACYVIYMVDTSAGDWIHWKTNNVTETSLVQGWASEDEYIGPYPPSGGTHDYEIYVIALKEPVERAKGAFNASNLKLKDNMLALDSSAEGVSGNILAYGHLKGTFTSE